MKTRPSAPAPSQAGRMPASAPVNPASAFYKSPQATSGERRTRPISNLDDLQPIFARLRPGVSPNWTTRYRVGAILAQHMDTLCTLDELGAELGITKQNAYTESVVALGTLVCKLYARMHFPRPRIASSAARAL